MSKKQSMRACKLNPKKRDRWLKIGTTGHWEGHSSGPFSLEERDYAQMLFNATRAGVDIVTDYEHATLYNPDKAPAAGWIKIEDTDPVAMKVEDGNLYVKIQWTQTAAEHIDAGEYRYLSPVFVANTYDRVSGKEIGWTLHSVALTNTPFLQDLGAIANTHRQSKNKEESTMSKTTQEQLDAANKKLQDKEQEIKDLKAKIEDQEKVIAASDKAASDAQIEEAIATGKLTEEQKPWAEKYALSDKEGFASYMKTLKPAQEQTPPTGAAYANSAASAASATPSINMTQV